MKRALFVVVLAACGAPQTAKPPPCDPVPLDPSPAWAGSNAATLTAWIDGAGCKSPGFDPAHPPVATFDWDDTIGKNDFGDGLTFWLIAHGKVHCPPHRDWHEVNPFLTAAAIEKLADACGYADPLPSATNPACADALLDLYQHGVDTGAFAGWNADYMEPAYALSAEWLAGYTHDEVRRFMTEMSGAELAAPHGATQTIGTHTDVNAWLRVYPEQKSLIRALASRGFDVWVITASPTDAIATVAPLAGVAPDHVVGVHSLQDAGGRLTPELRGCGPVPDGPARIINYKQGKRCAANKYIFDDAGAHALDVRSGRRQTFAAGDSDSDLFMLTDATFRLAIDRNRSQLMCAARGTNWLTNPMFIDPIAPFAGACP